jgi:hypothetical protein
LNAEISEDFAALILKMLEKKKEDRPHDFHEVLMAMRNLRVFKGLPPKRDDEM